jgi:hypothetical protein
MGVLSAFDRVVNIIVSYAVFTFKTFELYKIVIAYDLKQNLILHFGFGQLVKWRVIRMSSYYVRWDILGLLYSKFLLLLTYFYLITNKNKVSILLLKNNNKINDYVASTLNNLYNNILNIFKYFFLSFVLFIVFIYTLSVYNITPFLKLLFSWVSFGLVGYLLISGFVFFFKKYTYSKYTDVLQRFWKRSFSIFWLLEGSVFLIFIYLTLNSSNEVFYGFDTQALFKPHLGSLRIFFFKLLLINLVLILLNYLFSLCQNGNDDSIFSVYTLTSLVILYMTWVEFYQFYIYLQSINIYSWIYSLEYYEFLLDTDVRRSRTLNNYMLVCVVAKFWHFVFIIFVWFFYLNRYLESSDIRITLVSTSIQNFLILYILNLITLFPYFKFITRRYLNSTYKWFFIEFNESSLTVFWNFLFTFYSNLF